MAEEEWDDYGGLFEEEDGSDRSDYGSPQYWDDRYKESEEPFDWYFGWDRLSREISDYYSPSDSVLVIGCGNLEMPGGMLEAGFPRIVNTDISPTVIASMREKYAGLARLEWLEMDATKMTGLRDGEFDLVIDKGTIDAFMCARGSAGLVADAMGEVHRVLRPAGRFVVVSFGGPSGRLPVMRRARLGWTVHPPSVLEPEPGRQSGGSNYLYVFEKVAPAAGPK